MRSSVSSRKRTHRFTGIHRPPRFYPFGEFHQHRRACRCYWVRRVGRDPLLQRCGKHAVDISIPNPTSRLNLINPVAISDTTGFKGEIYADSSRETFRALDLKVTLKVTPKGEKKKSYLPSSRFVNAVTSAWVSTADTWVLRVSHNEYSKRLNTRKTLEGREISRS